MSQKYDIDFDVNNVFTQIKTQDEKITKNKSLILLDKSISLTKYVIDNNIGTVDKYKEIKMNTKLNKFHKGSC